MSAAVADIDCEAYRHHLRPHTAEERSKLEASLLAEGCRDPLVVAVLGGERFLIDGFHRKELIDRHSLAYETREVEFESGGEVLAWIEANARARRNQTGTERTYYLGCRYNREKGGHGGVRKPSDQVDHLTAERVAAEEKVGSATVRRAGKFAALLDKACLRGLAFLKWPVLSERLKVTPKLLARLVEMGAGGCREQIESLLAASPEKPVSAAAVREAIGDPPSRSPVPSAADPVDFARYCDSTLNNLIGSAMSATVEHVRQLTQMLEMAHAEAKAILLGKEKNGGKRR